MARILLIEDEPSIRLLLVNLLETAGHTVDEAGDGTEGIHALYNHAYALIILDIRMPKMDGYQFVEWLRQQLIYIPVLVLTAHRNLCADMMACGANGCLSKPFHRKELIDSVNQLLQDNRRQFMQTRHPTSVL